MEIEQETLAEVRSAIQTDRLVETAVRLIEVPSPTRSAGSAADRLEEILTRDGFEVERPEAGWPEAPAVAARLDSGNCSPLAPRADSQLAERVDHIGGRTLQFNGHLDTVHLPFVPPRVENGKLYGSGASDMKGGIAAMIEAVRVLRDTAMLTGGSVLLTAHELHEIPWGDGSQVDALIDAGYLGEAVLIPEYCADRLPVCGRGMAILHVKVSREGEPVHEVLGGIEQPSVIAAGAEVIRRFRDLDRELSQLTHPLAGRESLFVGQAFGGEIFNQAPTQFQLLGTRRWLPGTSIAEVEQRYQAMLQEVADETDTKIDGRFQLARDAFELDWKHPAVKAFQSVCREVMGEPLPMDAKPFVDDGNTFVNRGGIPAITHGPTAKGAHTLHEEVSIAELTRVALIYALTALAFCGE